MSDSASRVPAHPSLEQLRKRAKDLLRRHRAGDAAALERFRLAGPPTPETAALADAQFVLAREHGFPSWAKWKRHIEALPNLRVEQYEQLAKDLATAHMSGDRGAVRQVNRTYNTTLVEDFHDSLTKQQRLATWFASDSRTPELALADARQMIAHAYGFRDWRTFSGSFPQPFYSIHREENRLKSRGPQSAREWDAIFGVVKERGITALEAGGIGDAALKRLAKLNHVTRLSVNSDVLTDAGLQHLASMPQLLDLEIGGRQITDRGLEALRHLTGLRRFQSCWTPGISDAGAANLAFCDRLESVDLMGTAAGDGLIRALADKPDLRQLKTGRGVTDAGIELLHRIPVFKTWHGGDLRYGLMGVEPQPNQLLIDGPFTDSGLAKLAGLDGLFGLVFFWHCPAFTSAGLEHLRRLPNLGLLGCPDTHCDDEAMSRIAALPRLRMLTAQGAVATDKGWEALSRSQTIEYIWGRECPNLTGQGFAALGSMPALRGIGVSCRNVDDPSLALLPSFPSLRQIMPMDVTDAGFRHVGRCRKLESLWCMYCRDTGDAATEWIGELPQLKTYYAGMTRITDRSLEILGRMHSLERMEFWGCRSITDAGTAHLAALPQLREIAIDGSPEVSRDILARFPPRVHVKFPG